MQNEFWVRKTILIVDDEKSVLDILTGKLIKEGYSVVCACNGKEGLEISLKTHPDLILLDLLMPKMDGMTMLQKLRADKWGNHVRVIILSNLDLTNELISKVIDNRSSYYLLKSSNSLKKIVEKVNEVLEINQTVK